MQVVYEYELVVQARRGSFTRPPGLRKGCHVEQQVAMSNVSAGSPSACTRALGSDEAVPDARAGGVCLATYVAGLLHAVRACEVGHRAWLVAWRVHRTTLDRINAVFHHL